MARIAGIDLPGRKHTVIALQYIYGIGPHHAKHICETAVFPRASERMISTTLTSRESASASIRTSRSKATFVVRSTCTSSGSWI